MARVRNVDPWFGQKLFSYLTGDAKIREDAITSNIQRIYWTALIMSIGNLSAAHSFLTHKEPILAQEILWRKYIIRANFVLAFCSVVLWLIARHLRRGTVSLKIRSGFQYFVVFFVLGSGILLSYLDQMVLAGIAPILLVTTIVATFYYLPPWRSLLIFSSSFFIFYLVIVQTADVPVTILASNIINGLIAHVLGLALSTANWIFFRKGKLQERTIQAQKEHLKQMAYHDYLTNLPNRRLLDEIIKREIALVQKGQVESCLVILDIDDFKRVNDTYGHPVGDSVLQQFALLLERNIRSSHTLIRLGGEEFLILATHTTIKEAKTLSDQLRKVIATHNFQSNQGEIQITASIGIAALQGDETPDDYYTRADQALYRAKAKGKNQVIML